MTLRVLPAAIAASVLAAALPAAAAPAPPAPAAQANPWREMAAGDLAFIVRTLRAETISAVYPDPAGFAAKLSALEARAQGQLAQVSNFPGYHAVLSRLVNGLDDEHDAVSFSIGQTRLYWPGFVAAYVGQRYVVAASTDPAVPDGAPIQDCDGAPLDAWVARIAPYVGGHVGLESTKASAALQLLVDRGDPFVTRPTRCTIAGRPVKLDWTRLRYTAYARSVAPLAGVEDRTAAITPLGSDGAWVRLGYFQPDTPQEADAFRKVVAEAPGLRDKRLIVIDVRQNGGGPYNWFMDFINGLYGVPYADHYARARLAIREVYRATPEILAEYRAYDARDAAMGTPKDVAHDDPSTQGVADALAAGRPYYRVPPPPGLAQPTVAAPPDPVHAKVLVLTDYGCGSACIGFVDEMKRFPGVEQIGVETFVDSRTGTPLFTPLPSGNGTLMVATMTRDGRPRGDNVPQRPDRLYPGDISDTAAVKRWVLETFDHDPDRR